MKYLGFVLTVMVLVAGCTAGTDSPSALLQESGSTILVDAGNGTVPIHVANGTGAIVGEVLNDAGFGLPGAHVSLLGTDNGTTTNQTGWFQIAGVAPGKRTLRAEMRDYRAAESEVEIKAGAAIRVTVTMVPAVDGDAGYRPHVHDYWAGRREVAVLDMDRDFYVGFGGIAGQAQRAIDVVQYSLAVSCVLTDGKGVNAAASPVYFAEANQLVWPGTSKITFRPTWTQTAYTGSAIALAWKPANGTMYTLSGPIRSGDTFAIPVEPPMADAAHQMFTLWEFYICTFGKGETSVTSSPSPRIFSGQIHLTMTIVNGGSLMVDPPHPRFWQNGSRVAVINGSKTMTCVPNPGNCYGPALTARPRYPATFVWSPGTAGLVPPGTKYVYANLTWTASTGGPTKPLSVTMSPANIPAQGKRGTTGYKLGELVGQSLASRSYRLELVAGEADSYYQRVSNWAFLWGYEGQESTPEFSPPCACTLEVHLQVDAVMDPGYR